MKVGTQKVILPGVHQCVSLTNEHWSTNAKGELVPTGDELIVLFHGHSESAQKIYKRFGQYLDKQLSERKSAKKYSIIALNGLYPLPKHFPLDKEKKDEDLLAGYTWYFYDQRNDEFIIDYIVPVLTLTSFLKQINTQKLPTSFIGYSQGGYLAPFVGLAYELTKQVMGINCSFRFDLIRDQYQKVPFFLNQVQGRKDEIIDQALSHQRFNEMKKHYGFKGKYLWVDESNHWLISPLREKAIDLFIQSL